MNEPRICTRINRPSTECTAHNLHCGAPDCFAPQTTQPAPLRPLEQANTEHTRTLAAVARFAGGLEPDQHTELLRIVRGGIQRRDAAAQTDVELGARRNPAHADLDALMAGMGHTDRREAALLTIRREAHYTLKTLAPEGQTPQERLDELCRYLIDVVDAREPLPAQADAADGAGGAGAGDGGAR